MFSHQRSLDFGLRVVKLQIVQAKTSWYGRHNAWQPRGLAMCLRWPGKSSPRFQNIFSSVQ